MRAFEPQDACALPVVHEPVPEAQRVDVAPTTATVPLLRMRDAEVGIWGQSRGGMIDVEADEVFVMLAGRATVTLDDGAEIALVPGTLCALRAGMRTRWDVDEDLRKLYVTGTTEEITA